MVTQLEMTSAATTTIRSRWRWHDFAACGSLGALTWLAWLITPALDAPAEDAAMLMRYVTHVAGGHGIVWNIGQAPVDGATDLGVVGLATVLAMLGMNAEAAVTAVSAAGWVGLTALVYWAARTTHGRGPLVAFVAAAAIAVSRAPLYVMAGFAAPIFAFSVACALLAGMWVYRAPGALAALVFGVSWLTAGVIRPEGVLVGAFVAVALLVTRGSAALRYVATATAVVAVIGGVYLVWRWSYFGWPLPNPYYKKGGGTLHFDGLVDAARGALIAGTPFILLWPLACANPVRRSIAVLTGIPIAGFVLMWVLLSPAMNYEGRFQYPIAALVAVSWPALLPRGWPALIGRRRVLLGAAVVVAGLPLVLGVWWPSPTNVGHAQVAEVLAARGLAGARVATTEAGLVPLRTRWEALDLWGLNDPTVAHRGYLAVSDIDRFGPTVLFVHHDPEGALGVEWNLMAQTATEWARAEGFVPARIAVDPNTPGATWQLWVSPAAPQAAALVEALRCGTYSSWEASPEEVSGPCSAEANAYAE